MKIKKPVTILAIFVLIIVCIGIFAGCGDKATPPYYVRLDVYKPDGELVELEPYTSYSARLSLKYDGNPKVFGIKVYSKGQERYINDNDIEEGTLNSKIEVSIMKEDDPHHFPIDFEDDNSWPTEAGYYDLIISFNDLVIGSSNLDKNYRIAAIRIYLTIEEE